MVAQAIDRRETVLVAPKLGNLSLVRASDVGQTYGLNVLIYGQSGTGKTTLAASAQDSPYGADVLFVDLEGGTLSLLDRPEIAIYRPEKFDDITKLVHMLATEKHSFKTVVVDSLTEAQTLAIESVTGKGKAETINQQGWGTTNNRLLQLVRLFRSLTHTKQINTIFTALAKEDVLDSGISISRPALTPGSATNVTAAVDAVGYMTFNPKTDKRIVHFEGSGRFVAKVRQASTNRRIPKSIENPSMVDILAAMRGEGPAEGKAM